MKPIIGLILIIALSGIYLERTNATVIVTGHSFRVYHENILIWRATEKGLRP